MTLTEAQLIIIRTVCSYQFKSLQSLLLQPDLDQEYLDILESYDATRKDYDDTLMETHKQFQEVWKDPEKLFELEDIDLEVFKFILGHIQGDFVNIYPKALNNIWNRILVHQMTQYINN